MRPGRRPCAADIREPNINRPRPSARARASTCLVGTFTRARSRRRGARRANRLVGARRVFFFRFAFAFAFARDSTPDGRRASLMRRRVPSRAPDEPPRDSCCRPRLAVPSRCVYSRAHTLPSFYFVSEEARETNSNEPACHGVGSNPRTGRDPLCPSVALRATHRPSHRSRPASHRRWRRGAREGFDTFTVSRVCRETFFSSLPPNRTVRLRARSARDPGAPPPPRLDSAGAS